MSAFWFKFETGDIQKYKLTNIHLKNSLWNKNIYLDMCIENIILKQIGSLA